MHLSYFSDFLYEGKIYVFSKMNKIGIFQEEYLSRLQSL